MSVTKVTRIVLSQEEFEVLRVHGVVYLGSDMEIHVQPVINKTDKTVIRR